MTEQEKNLRAAAAGLAYATRSLWPEAPPKFDDAILAQAEFLAIGQEQVQDGSPPALGSIFSRLRGIDGEIRYLPRLELALDAKTVVPKRLSDVSGSFSELHDKFRDTVAGLKAVPGSQSWLESALDALQRYAWCIPAPQYGDESDVSLYNHARITAALTVCLANDGDPKGEVALLIGGDLSGVQDWLYTLGSSGAAKSLRGRSFYLQLLTEVIAYKLLDDLDLPLTNLIYAGGGNFYVLAHPTVIARFSELAHDIGQVLLDAHEGDLYLSMGCTPIQASELSAGKIGAAWGRINDAIGKQKRQRFANLGEPAMAATIGVALRQGGKPDKVCSICQRENPDGAPWPLDKDDPDVGKCGLCASLEELGRLLPDATHIVVARLDKAVREATSINHWQDGLRALGYHVTIVDAEKAPGQPPRGALFARIGRIKPQSNPILDGQAGYAYGDIAHAFAYRPLVNVVPHDQGQIATFDQLCRNAKGLERWGVLRMDVDDLGRLFRDGFGDRATLTRTTQLSFALRLFFEGRLNVIGARYNVASNRDATVKPGVEPTRDGVYAMYSGGDDLFVVGSWDALPHLAHDIRQEFKRFVAGNPLLTLSGGISLASERFPLYQAAQQAGQAEVIAKDYERGNGGHSKDALAFLGQVIGWEQFDDIWAQVARLQAWSEAKPSKINRSLIQTLRAIDVEYRSGLKRQQQLRAEGKPGQVGQFYYGPWMWKLVYQLSRVAEQAKSADVREWILTLRDSLVEPTGPISTLGLTARWAEYLTRKSKED